MADYQLLTTTTAGVPYAEIANAAIQSITWELNGWGEATWTLPVDDAQAWLELRKEYQTKREIQIWRNGTLIWWGVYVAGIFDGDSTVTFTAYGLLWYFSRRYFGPVHSNTMPQLMINGDMENATIMTGWTKSAGATVTASTSNRRSGAQAMKIVTSSAAGVENYVAQGINIPTPARVRPLPFTLSAWLKIETLTTPHPIDNAMILGPGGSPSNQAQRITPDHALGVWHYIEDTYEVPASSTTGLVAVLYAPTSGTVYWDDARVTYQQRTGAIDGEDWATDYLRRIFELGAGNNGGGTGGSPIWWGAPVNKSSLNMTFTAGSASSNLRSDRFWDHADEGNIFAAMADLAARNVLDFEITWPSNGRSRALVYWAPRKGSTKAGLAAELGRNIIGQPQYAVDGRRRSNDVRVSARAPGALREVGQAGGPTVATGPQLETVVSPPFEIAGPMLAEAATAELARLTDPVSTPTITVTAGMYMGDTAEAGSPLTVGDSIPSRIDYGWVQEAATRRVVKMTLRPPSEELDLVFNES